MPPPAAASGAPQAEVSATCCWPEVDGQLLTLSALARQPLTCCWTAAVPVVGGVQAAYITSLAASPKDLLAVLLVGQLLPEGEGDDVLPAAGGERDQDEGEGPSTGVESSAPSASGMTRSSSMAPAAAASSNGAAAKSTTGKEGPAPEGLFTGGGAGGGGWKQRQRGVVQLLVRSSSHEVMLVLKEHAAMWVRDVSGVSDRGDPPDTVCVGAMRMLGAACCSFRCWCAQQGCCQGWV
jgi:hypothetical protein